MPNEEYIYQSEHTGSTVDEGVGIAIDNKTYWDNKVDRVAGKGLSTNDYTTAEKDKLTRLDTLMNGINSITTTVQNNNTTIPTGKAILDTVSQLGGGDMMRASYDTTNTGSKVDTAILSENSIALNNIVKAGKITSTGDPNSAANPSSYRFTYFMKIRQNTGTGNNSVTALVVNTQHFVNIDDPDLWLVRALVYRDNPSSSTRGIHASAQCLTKASGGSAPSFGYVYDDSDPEDVCWYIGIKRTTTNTAATKVIALEYPTSNNFAVSPSPVGEWGHFATEPQGWTEIPYRGVNLNTRTSTIWHDASAQEDKYFTTLDILKNWLLDQTNVMANFSVNFYIFKTGSSFDNSLFDTGTYYVAQIFKPSADNGTFSVRIVKPSASKGERVITLSRVGGVWSSPTLVEDGISLQSFMLRSEDTRSDNNVPSYYMNNEDLGIVSEFKRNSTMGLPTSSGNLDRMDHDFSQVDTFIPWLNDTGGKPVQLALGGSHSTYTSPTTAGSATQIPIIKARASNKASDTWGAWQTLATRERDLNRTTPVTEADTNLATIMARGIYAGTTDMVAGSTALPAGVIYLVYEV